MTFHDLGQLFGLTAGRASLLIGTVLAALADYVLRNREGRLVRLLDVGVAASLGLLTVGLILGLSASQVKFAQFADYVNQGLAWVSERLGREEPFAVKSFRLKQILMYGVPPILCYTLIARPVRFSGLVVARGGIPRREAGATS